MFALKLSRLRGLELCGDRDFNPLGVIPAKAIFPSTSLSKHAFDVDGNASIYI
ncbi:MAG: hypothetical protein M1412_05610 [Deltaproteobacteria bacterium]|nr:hypothetical protein [Deltaproteobacteria bacterium]MCL5892625.1 hypothetical protein [Deltaproteobacteria bacterium]